MAATEPVEIDREQIPRCEALDGSTLRIVQKYTEAGYFCEANIVFLTDGVRTMGYVPYQPPAFAAVIDMGGG